MKIVLTILGLCVLIGCSAGTPSTAVVPTSVPTVSASTRQTMEALPTVVPPATSTTAASVDPATIFRPVASALAPYKPIESDPRALRDALAQAVIQFIDTQADPNMPLPGQPALNELANALSALKLPEQVKPGVAAIHLRDSEGGSEDLLLVSLENMTGLPVIGIHRLGTSFQVLDIQGPSLGQGQSAELSRSFRSGTVQGADVTGDSVGEAIYTYIIPGGSAVTQELHILRWMEDTQKPKTIFEATLVSWAGESKYALIPGNKGQNVQITYPWFGVFDHKLAEHPRATQVWTYDATKDQLVKQSETIEAPKTVRQQLNVAERLFRQGEWDKAVTEYERAWKDTTLTEENFGDNKPATRAFARFRQGELLALLGQIAAARTALTDAQKAGGDVGKLAAAFLKNMTGSDPAIRALASLPAALDLYDSIYQGKSNLDMPANARDILFQGGIAAAYLDAHPDTGSQLVKGLFAAGAKPNDATWIDMDGDVTKEYLVVMIESSVQNPSQSLWLVYHGQTRWLARLVMQETAIDIRNVLPIKGSVGNPVKILFGSNGSSNERLIAWDRNRIIDLDPTTFKPISDVAPWPVFGDGKTDSDF